VAHSVPLYAYMYIMSNKKNDHAILEYIQSSMIWISNWQFGETFIIILVIAERIDQAVRIEKKS